MFLPVNFFTRGFQIIIIIPYVDICEKALSFGYAFFSLVFSLLTTVIFIVYNIVAIAIIILQDIFYCFLLVLQNICTHLDLFFKTNLFLLIFSKLTNVIFILCNIASTVIVKLQNIFYFSLFTIELIFTRLDLFIFYILFETHWIIICYIIYYLPRIIFYLFHFPIILPKYLFYNFLNRLQKKYKKSTTKK